MFESQNSDFPLQSQIPAIAYIFVVATLLFFQGVQAFPYTQSTLIQANIEVLAIIVAYMTTGGVVLVFLQLYIHSANVLLTRYNKPTLFPAQTRTDPTDRYMVFKYLGQLIFLTAVMGDAAAVLPLSEQGGGAGGKEVVIMLGIITMIFTVMIGLAIGGYVFIVVARRRNLEESGQLTTEVVPF